MNGRKVGWRVGRGERLGLGEEGEECLCLCFGEGLWFYLKGSKEGNKWESSWI